MKTPSPAEKSSALDPAVAAGGWSRAVQLMFGSIASRYDFLNHLLSLNFDRAWRRRCAIEVSKKMQHFRAEAWAAAAPVVLDLGCGTGDLTSECAQRGPVVGCDFSAPMLKIAKKKMQRRHLGRRWHLIEGDINALPFRSGSFDAVVSAFVLRNLASIPWGLKEMRRVLRRGGVLAILDFAMPRAPMLGGICRLYLARTLPRIGTLISGVHGPYQYLTDSVRAFAAPAELQKAIEDSGFTDVSYRLYTGGMAVLFLASAGD